MRLPRLPSVEHARPWRPALRWIALLALCAAYLQGGLDKLLDFPAAISEMQHFNIRPATETAAAVIVLELLGSGLILFGRGRWRLVGALTLATFTVAANLIANPFWSASQAQRQMMANGFFEHIGLAGGFLLVALMNDNNAPAGDEEQR